MSTEELRVRVAGHDGWDIQTEKDGQQVWGNQDGLAIYPDSEGYNMLPRYTESLDACHAFEEGLTESEREDYILALIDLKEPYWSLVIATAEQRCRAFVRVKEGK